MLMLGFLMSSLIRRVSSLTLADPSVVFVGASGAAFVRPCNCLPSPEGRWRLHPLIGLHWNSLYRAFRSNVSDLIPLFVQQICALTRRSTFYISPVREVNSVLEDEVRCGTKGHWSDFLPAHIFLMGGFGFLVIGVYLRR